MQKRYALFILILLIIAGQGYSQHSDPVEVFAHTLPVAGLNTVPGFGLGSYLQGDQTGFKRALILDSISWALMGGSLAILYARDDTNEDEAGFEGLTLLAGYGVFFVSKAYGFGRPLLFSFREGIPEENLVAPVFYNLLPGFGLGSHLQGDRRGAVIGFSADLAAFGLIGVLSFAALGGMEQLANVAGVGILALFATNKVYGVFRPHRFLEYEAPRSSENNR